MLRNIILKKYIDIETIKYSIGHEFSVFLPLLVRNLFLLMLFLVFFVILKRYNLPTNYLYLALSGVGTVLFIKFLIDFFNLYLDTLAVGKYNITLFMRDGLFDNSIEIFDWDRIESISYSQESFWDRIFMKGDILIRLDDNIEFPFENVYKPKKVIKKLTRYKDQFIAKKLRENDTNERFEQDERFSILVDALSEVVKDYAKK